MPRYTLVEPTPTVAPYCHARAVAAPSSKPSPSSTKSGLRSVAAEREAEPATPSASAATPEKVASARTSREADEKANLRAADAAGRRARRRHRRRSPKPRRRRAQARAASLRRARPARPRRRAAQKARWQAARDKLRARASTSSTKPKSGSAGPTSPSSKRCAPKSKRSSRRVGIRRKPHRAQAAARRLEGRRPDDEGQAGAAVAALQGRRLLGARARPRATSPSSTKQRGANLAKKEELAARVTSACRLPAIGRNTAELIEALQEEWKAGSACSPRTRPTTVWKRFRVSCDKFYYSAGRRTSPKATPKASASLFQIGNARVRPSSSWPARPTGSAPATRSSGFRPSGRRSARRRANKSEEVWKRFRAACDTFFDARKVPLRQARRGARRGT